MSDNTTKEVTISGVLFSLSTPYAEGHAITAAEARALNQTRCENVANNMRKAVKDAANEDGTHSDDTLKALAKLVADYDAEYEFSMAAAGGRRVTDPLEKECISIAKSMLATAIKGAGQTVKAYLEVEGNKDKYDANIVALSEREDVVKAAKKRLKERADLAANQIEIEL